MIIKQNTCVLPTEFFEYFGINPLLANYIDLSTCVTDYKEPACESAYVSYHNDYSSPLNIQRIAVALEDAQAKIENFIGHPICETQVCDTIEFEKHYRHHNSIGRALDSYVFTASKQCITRVGQWEKVVIDTATVIDLIDQDGDGFDEIAVIEWDYSGYGTTFVENDLELHITGYDNYNTRIDSIEYYNNDTINSVITWHVPVFEIIDPELYIHKSFAEKRLINGCSTDTYITTLDVVELQKSCKPDGYLYYTDSGCGENCEELTVPFCIIPVNITNGTFQIRLGGLDENGCFTTDFVGCSPSSIEVTRISAYYLAGCSNCNTNSGNCTLLHRATILLAASMIDLSNCDICGTCLSKELVKQSIDTAILTRNGDRYSYSYRTRVNNPFGTTIGAFTAYEIVDAISNTCY